MAAQEEFLQLYVTQLAEGKVWAVEADVSLIDVWRWEECTPEVVEACARPFEDTFDYCWFTPGRLRLRQFLQPLDEAGRRRIYEGEPLDTLPNAWHMSDHLPVGAVFEFA
jgi:hypothetical protein